MSTPEGPAGDVNYEEHGRTYASVRRTDPRVEPTSVYGHSLLTVLADRHTRSVDASGKRG